MPTKTTKKVTNKKVVDKKEEVKAVKPVEEKKVETKPVAEKKAPAKKVAAEKKALAKKVEAKPAEEKKAPAKKVAAEKKAPAKKEEAKPAEEKKAPAKKVAAEKKAPAKKEETKPAEEKKAPAKKATAKKKAPAKKEEAKPAEEKKATVEKKTPAKKAAAKPATTKKASTKKKTTTKKATTKKMTKEEQYARLSLDTCLDLAKAMSMDVTRDSIIQQLILNPDVKSVSENLVNKYQLTGKFNFEEDGYDEGLVEVLVSKVFETADIKPQKPEDLQADVTHALNYKYTDVVADGEEYKDQFDTMRKVLMIAQHKDIHDSKKLEEVGVDVEKFVEEFMDLAYSVLKTWKYEDVDYYEHFIYAVLSQLEDLHNKYSNRIMMDVADLYILHGDYGLGDADYAYILRENQIKDYIYYRYASIYEGVDKDKAKQIANQALQFVDDRFTYYPNIIAVLEG